MSLSNDELYQLANQLHIPLTKVLMKNEFGKKRENGNFIVNLASDNDGSNGTHWVTLIVRDNYSFYFDSFGCLPPEEIKIFVSEAKKPIYYNTFEIQDLNSSLCGFYCIAILNFITTHRDEYLLTSCNDFINLFVENTKLNGIILKKYLCSLKLPLKWKKYLLSHK